MAINIQQNAPDILQLLEAGVFPGFVRYKKFGRSPIAPKDIWTTIWDGNVDYPYPSANLVSPTIVSTDAADTQDVIIEGVDQEFKYVIQTVTLNGLTPVPLSKDIMIPFRMEGDGEDDLQGQIDLAAAGTSYAIIRNGGDSYNQTQMSIMVIPAGYYGFITKVGASIAALNSGEINYRAKAFGKAWKVKRPLDLTSQVVPEEVDFFFDEKTILDVRVMPSANNTSTSAWFDVILIEKALFIAEFGEPFRATLAKRVTLDD